jgi:hypothetical protein
VAKAANYTTISPLCDPSQIVLVILGANLTWSIVGSHTHSKTGKDLSLLTITGVDTAANLFGIAITLVLARSQWVRIHRPTIGFAIDDEGANFLDTSDKWYFWFSNAGPGGAVIDSVDFRIAFIDEIGNEEGVPWQPILKIEQLLESRGFVSGKHYFLRYFGFGFPFPATAKYSEGNRLGWFSVETLAAVRQFDVRVRVHDHVGDSHERRINFMNSLPTVTKSLILQRRRTR